MPKIQDLIIWLVKGVCIGIANIIPGVSGGTMALVLGIYERMITALNNMGPQTAIIALKALTFKKEAIADGFAELKRIDFAFCCAIGLGALAAVVGSAGIITYLLNHQHDPTYAFFCGLILVSIITPWKMLRKFGLAEAAALLVAVVLTVMLARMMANDQQIEREQEKYVVKMELEAQKEAAEARGETFELADTNHSPRHLMFMFVCGAIAISAMILPGISGSFLLLLLGAYFPLLQAIKSYDLVICGVFGVGMRLGILAFTRLLKWLFSRYHDPTVAFLVGLMLGSLYGLWPFRNYAMIGDEASGYERVDGRLVMPELDGNLAVTVVAFLAGCAVIAVFLLIEKKLGKAEGLEPIPAEVADAAQQRGPAPDADDDGSRHA